MSTDDATILLMRVWRYLNRQSAMAYAAKDAAGFYWYSDGANAVFDILEGMQV